MDKQQRAELMYEELISETNNKQVIIKNGIIYEVQAVTRSIVIVDKSCNCTAITDGPINSIESIKELL